MVVRELLRIQGAQRGSRMQGNQRGSGMQGNQRGSGGTLNWLQRACGGLLSDRLMKEDGVHSVLVGILGATAGKGVGSGCHGDWKRVQAVAKIISRCPSQVPSLSHYYSIIGPQLLKLLSVAGRATVQVSAATLSLMIKTQPALTRSHVVLLSLLPSEP
ncbi:Transport and Golgi organization protein 6 homolog [Geodia barretti]|uniref:Transport and Golgi organization protein 6 homolog n=1 Tax=Geodia barretti TaxID=519541 RepID=A0AA35W7U6_GEOBA|nr:Transport and Golgi organization protein 6 homolog [Geodia barretti]